MKTLIPIVSLFIMTTTYAQHFKSFHDFTVTTIEGDTFPLARLKGKKVLVVNTASRCGYTPQYAKLEELYMKFGGESFTVIGFPANNFNNQEPGTNEEIMEFCRLNFGVTFPMMEKISVRGSDIAPLYKWLTEKDLNGEMDAPVKWNFQKFMINEDGTLEGVIPPGDSPLSEKITRWITRSR